MSARGVQKGEKDFPFAEIEEKLEYAFQDKELLRQAFTHSSYGNLYGVADNERMEYLGDSVLQLVVTEWQYKKDERSEGRMSEARQQLVCREALDTAVDGLGIYGYLLYSGRKENLGDKTKSSLFEAVAGAIFIDGGFFAARKFILAHGNISLSGETQNYKGALQEFLQARGETPPKYASSRQGPDHAPHFSCTASAMGQSAEGEGKNLREAEGVAAYRLLWELKKKYGENTPSKKRKK